MADAFMRAPDGVAVAQRFGLHGEFQAVLKFFNACGLIHGPGFVGEAFAEHFRVGLELAAVNGFVAGGRDNADLFNAGVHRLFGDDLQHGLGHAVAVHQRYHGFLHGIGRRILPGAPACRRYHRPSYVHPPPFRLFKSWWELFLACVGGDLRTFKVCTRLIFPRKWAAMQPCCQKEEGGVAGFGLSRRFLGMAVWVRGGRGGDRSGFDVT